MFKYEFVRIESSFSGWGLGAGNTYETDDYRDLINEKAKNGWRFVGVIPATQRGTGHVSEMDLVFEKQTD